MVGHLIYPNYQIEDSESEDRNVKKLEVFQKDCSFLVDVVELQDCQVETDAQEHLNRVNLRIDYRIAMQKLCLYFGLHGLLVEKLIDDVIGSLVEVHQLLVDAVSSNSVDQFIEVVLDVGVSVFLNGLGLYEVNVFDYLVFVHNFQFADLILDFSLDVLQRSLYACSKPPRRIVIGKGIGEAVVEVENVLVEGLFWLLLVYFVVVGEHVREIHVDVHCLIDITQEFFVYFLSFSDGGRSTFQQSVQEFQ